MMDARQQQQPRQQARQRGQVRMQARQEQADEVRQWERDWRETMTGQMRDIAKSAGDMALVVREMQGDVKELMEWKAGMQKRRDYHDDKRSEEWRGNLALLVSAAGFGLLLLIYVAGHWKP